MLMVIASASPVLSSSVLVLNRSYVAVRVVNVRCAFVLLYREVAEVIHIEDGRYVNYDLGSWCELSQFWIEDASTRPAVGDGDWIRTVSLRIHVPRIVRLLSFDRPPRNTVRLNRKNVFARDGSLCQYCGQSFPNSQLSFDHVKPKSRGGPTSWDNVVTCCLRCNAKKGDRTPQEAGMRLRTRPSKPSHHPILKVKLGNPRYHTWKPFLGQSSHAIDVA
jgi:5-methylcytosine-specific restriction endonuclease McrA